MTILALEFSSHLRSVAVVRPAAPGTEALCAEVIETDGRFTRAFGMIEEALRTAQISQRDIECIAVGLGPGSYHGIRVAISVAQGWSLVRPVKLIGMTSVECIAVEAHTQGMRGTLGVVLDAQRGECYVAGYTLHDCGSQETRPILIASGAALKEFGEAHELIVGPEANRLFPRARTVAPRAAMLGRLAAGRTEFVPGEKLEPLYLRQTTFVKAPPPRVPFASAP
jgi:tRNA threonylcarbamoyl adenosine modification protein YeaZ